MTDTTEEPWTVLRLLNWTTDFFKKHGSDSARLDAEILLAHARDCSRVDLYTTFDAVPTDEQRVAFREMIRRRGEGTPVAQLVGYKEFYSQRFRVNENVLIPRPETEELVTRAIDFAKQRATVAESPMQIADVGTGSGALAVTLAKQLPECQITAIDVSPEAIEIARWNADKLSVIDRVDFHHSDLFAAIDSEKQFDLICSNPPYVTEAEYADLDRSVREFEPKLALVAGPEGSEIIARLLAEAVPRLLSGGKLMIEFSPMIADACRQIAESTVGLTDVKVIKDMAGRMRFLECTKAD